MPINPRLNNSIAAIAGVLVALAAAAPARAADTASGAIRCNATSIPIRAAISRWDTGKRELRVMLFKSQPTLEAVKFWTEGAGRGGYPAEWGHAAAFTFTFKDAGAQATQATLRDYSLYVDCPDVQANFSASVVTPRGAEKVRLGFPAFEATLGPGGKVRLTARGEDKLSMPAPTAVTWDVNVDSPIYSK